MNLSGIFDHLEISFTHEGVVESDISRLSFSFYIYISVLIKKLRELDS